MTIDYENRPIPDDLADDDVRDIVDPDLRRKIYRVTEKIKTILLAHDEILYAPLVLPPLSASPGFTWGKAGNVRNAYLLNDTVPSNKSGRIVPVDGTITTVFMSVTNPSKGSIDIRKRVGDSLVTLTTITLTGDRRITVLLDEDKQPVVVKNDELAAYVNDIEMSNVIVGVIIKGSI